jgi:hypothetical protein
MRTHSCFTALPLLLLAAISVAQAPSLLWHQTYGGPDTDRAYSLDLTSGGGFVLTGTTQSYGAGYYDVYLVKVTSLGIMQWDRTFGGSGEDYGYSVVQTSDGGYAIAGYTESFGAGNKDVYLIKTDQNGNLQWEMTFGGSDDDIGESLLQTPDGGYIIAGATHSYGGMWDVFVVRTDSEGTLEWQQTYGGGGTD